jgi:osmotically inducible protein OsmC
VKQKIKKMKRSATAHWKGDLNSGSGNVTTQSLVLDKTPYSFNTRFGDGAGSNPEELLGAAHAACFTMALAYALSQSGFKPNDLETTAEVAVDLSKGGLTGIELTLNASIIEGLSETGFFKFANDAKQNCPVSKALSGVEISLNVHYEAVGAAL